MALELSRLIRNLANLKNKETAKNKFLKTKPKIQEMKQNVEKAREEALAVHDYVQAAEVASNPANIVPPFEMNSFKPLIDLLLEMFESSTSSGTSSFKTPLEKEDLVQAFENKLEIGIAVTNAGQRYLTTRARALEIGATFQPMNNTLAAALSQGGGTIK